MGSYDNVFGGNTIDPADLSWVRYEIDEDLTLVWPFEAVADSDVAAFKIGVTPTVAGLSVMVPAANLASTGRDILFYNEGAEDFDVQDASGMDIGTVGSGQEWLFTLVDNSDAAGEWISVQLGAGTSSATAASLAGKGLRALLNKLDQNFVVTTLSAIKNFTTADRAGVFINTGGAFTWTFDSAATLTNGWFAYVINAGSGAITLDPNGADTIDGTLTKTINPEESALIFTNGVTALYSFGYNNLYPTDVNFASINLAAQGGTGDFTLSVAEVASQVQNYVGTITGNRTIFYGNTPGIWSVYNNYGGSFTTTFKTNVSDSGIVIQAGQYVTIRSDGSNMQFGASYSGSQTFTTNGTFTWPVCKGAMIDVCGGGAGGSRGAQGVASGSGGSGGARMQVTIIPPAAGTTTTVTIGAGGAGATANNTVGVAGGSSSFGDYLVCQGGVAAADSATGGNGGSGGGVSVVSGAGRGWVGAQGGAITAVGNGAEFGGGGGGGGQNANAAGPNGGFSHFGGGAGGAGGFDAGAGGTGGSSNAATANGGAGGTGGTGGTGSNGAVGSLGHVGSGGGGGGGNAAGAGGVGGNGGLPGGGGGGGGHGSTVTGNGGAGAAGQVVVYWW